MPGGFSPPTPDTFDWIQHRWFPSEGAKNVNPIEAGVTVVTAEGDQSCLCTAQNRAPNIRLFIRVAAIAPRGDTGSIVQHDAVVDTEGAREVERLGRNLLDAGLPK